MNELMNEHDEVVKVALQILRSTQFLLTSVMTGTVYCGVILLFVPQWVLFLTRKWCAHFCHLTGVSTESSRVHRAPV